ncbi:MAG: hypothetical protein NVSMB21_00750 [Vulcanimicrobiaceae bacterium]
MARERRRAGGRPWFSDVAREINARMMHSDAPTVVAAIFAEAAQARVCADVVRRRGFAESWLALVHADDDSGETRYYSGETSLADALVAHGLGGSDADAIETHVPAHGAVLVVRTGARHAEAIDLLERSGGRVHGAASRERSNATTGVPDRIVSERQAGADPAVPEAGDYVPTEIAARAGLNRTTLGASVPNVPGYPTSSSAPADPERTIDHQIFERRAGGRPSGMIPNPGTLSRPETSGDIEKRDKEASNG